MPEQNIIAHKYCKNCGCEFEIHEQVKLDNGNIIFLSPIQIPKMLKGNPEHIEQKYIFCFVRIAPQNKLLNLKSGNQKKYYMGRGDLNDT